MCLQKCVNVVCTISQTKQPSIASTTDPTVDPVNHPTIDPNSPHPTGNL